MIVLEQYGWNSTSCTKIMDLASILLIMKVGKVNSKSQNKVVRRCSGIKKLKLKIDSNTCKSRTCRLEIRNRIKHDIKLLQVR